jgi:hypothetical protein
MTCFPGTRTDSGQTGRLLAYLKITLTALANGHPQSRLDELLPWNFTPSR